MDKKIYISLSDIKPSSTAHGIGEKFVFLTNEDSATSITQFAYGTLHFGEEVETHLHPTMEEYFYFISGEGEYVIDNIKYHIHPATFIRIPANTSHSLKTISKEPLTFVYFGAAL